ncbi:MAG: hypothetical protein LBH00_05510 [Planctomycetaceae bacterium]|nr:hypothetical protein [Planctomycetaceae bacterium]
MTLLLRPLLHQTISVFTFMAVMAAVFALPAFAGAAENDSKPGLLILTHGAPSPKWAASIKTFAEKTAALNETKKTFHAVTAANMEFAKPDAADGIKLLEEAGCDRIVVVPAFICPTSHTHFDVPASLGLYTSPSIRKTMAEENIKPAKPKVPVIVTQTISEGDLLDKFVRDEIAALSETPADEAVLLIAHGDEQHAGLVEPVMRRLLVEAVGSKGITLGDWAFCEVGQSYRQNVVPVIQEMAKNRKRVLVVGFYLVSSAKSITNAGLKTGARPAGYGTGANTDAPKDPFEGIDVRFSEKGVIDHPYAPQWVLQTASDAL